MSVNAFSRERKLFVCVLCCSLIGFREKTLRSDAFLYSALLHQVDSWRPYVAWPQSSAACACFPFHPYVVKCVFFACNSLLYKSLYFTPYLWEGSVFAMTFATKDFCKKAETTFYRPDWYRFSWLVASLFLVFSLVESLSMKSGKRLSNLSLSFKKTTNSWF